jgi:hypothetical protein
LFVYIHRGTRIRCPRRHIAYSLNRPSKSTLER